MNNDRPEGLTAMRFTETTAGERECANPDCGHGQTMPNPGCALPAEPDAGEVEALTAILADWLDIRSDDTPRDTARHILASPWLAAHVSAAETKARGEAWDEAVAHVARVARVGSDGLNDECFEGNPYRAARAVTS